MRTSSPLPPGPHLPVFAQTVLFGAFRHKFLPLLRRRYGDLVRLRIYPERNVVLVGDVELIREVFSGPVETFHAGEGNVVLKPIMGEHSVLLTDEQEHLRTRKLLMPAFHGAALRGYRAMVTDLTRAELDSWQADRPFRVHERMQALTLEIILRVVFGVGEGPRLEELRKLLGHVIDVGALDIFGWHSPVLQKLGPWRRNREIAVRVDELIHAEIADRRTAPDLENRTDVLSRLLTVPGDDPLTDTELRDQLVTLLLAGHETTATALAWSLHELARNPVAAAATTKAADEGDERYLEAVAKEAMRLHPIISEVARRLTKDIEFGGYRIPAGHTVLPSISMVHADPAHHPSPEVFDPARFLGGGPATGTWFPFGGGVRRCLGAGFSLLEATIVLEELFRRYRLTPAARKPERTKTRHITLVPGDGARIVVHNRELPRLRRGVRDRL
ncbi:cytochrome P450 [Amycolatopsis sp. FDAARGOS 1241]|uniref:cytochrome P450 n=1 Tax=Amycolatopsis sp. FDAARGOS 1241 TaxID=2778070 RepID=UPI00194E0D9A|nr:cytochrome P450 [Amycolatopsis sp. FDAARGOS 1241]QRP50019.1 cytochrome P450 [Amycolatopsis sp. FDAARGOS 1241]